MISFDHLIPIEYNPNPLQKTNLIINNVLTWRKDTLFGLSVDKNHFLNKLHLSTYISHFSYPNRRIF